MTPQLKLSAFAQWCQIPHPGTPEALPLVIDVREPWEVQTASVVPDGFTLLHIPMRQIVQRIGSLQQTYGSAHPIACLCHHGIRSLQVANYLGQNGFTQVVNLQGGIQAWSEQLDSGVPLY